MKRARTIAVGSALLLTCASGTASGAAPAQRFFHTPGQSIECELTGGSQGHAYCQTIRPEESVTLGHSGKGHICKDSGCVGNGPENALTLANGKTISLGQFHCTNDAGSVLCELGANGFEISQSRITLTKT